MFRCVQPATRQVASLVSVRLQHTLPPLPYEYNALEPVISADIMQLHHSKHHAAYVTNLNASMAKYKEAKDKNHVNGMIAAGHAIKFNGGGHINHSIFWSNLSPKGGGEPNGDLLQFIQRDFGSFDKFRDQMSAATVGIQGSGWGWLGYDQFSKRLVITTCPNQDPLQGTTGLYPLLGIDVWEHAYYLQYKNVRPDYVKAIWKIINWHDVATRFQKGRE